MNKSERVKAQVSLREVVEAGGMVWDLKKSAAHKGDWWGPCPLHGEATASFHVVETGGAGGWFKCFGCQAGGTVIDFVMALDGLDFTTAVRRLADQAGVAGEMSDERKGHLAAKREAAKADAKRAAAKKADDGERIARQLWGTAERGPAADLLARYLAARGVNLSVIGGVPPSLRLQPSLTAKDGARDPFQGPAMVAAVGRGSLVGIHRTWITAHGRARHPDGAKVAKQWLGRTGEMFGQPCALSSPTAAVVVGEGIETTLAGWSGLLAAGHVGWSAEAGLARGAITGPAQDPAALWTPRPGVAEVLILGEGSSKRPREARELYEGAQARLEGLGLRVLLTVPGGRWDLDQDFADVAASGIGKG